MKEKASIIKKQFIGVSLILFFLIPFFPCIAFGQNPEAVAVLFIHNGGHRITDEKGDANRAISFRGIEMTDVLENQRGFNAVVTNNLLGKSSRNSAFQRIIHNENKPFCGEKYFWSVFQLSAGISNCQVREAFHGPMSFKERSFSIVGYAYENPIFIIIVVATLFILIILAIVVIFLSKKRSQENAMLMEEKRRNQLLIDALEVAEKADAAKSQFLSRVSHEMRTPLNAIIGFIALAKETDGKQVYQYLHNSEIAAKQLLSVINDVLDMSIIESGKIRIANEPFHFKQVIQSISAIYDAQCQDKGLFFETQILSPVDEWLVGDRLRLNQILLNLLGNAVKFTEENSIYFKIRRLAPKADRVFIRFEIKDTGCGMTKEMQKRLFKPFEQESSVTAQKFGGSGLGLSIVKNLITLMDGAVSVRSKANKGSTFTVDIPFTISVENPTYFPTPEFRKLRVLVINNDTEECKYISEVLNQLGIFNTYVAECEDVITILERGIGPSEKYNVCLIDWKISLPQRLEVICGIRQVSGKDICIVVASSYINEQETKKMKGIGADLFIFKPLFQSTIYELLTKITGEEPTAQSEPAPQAEFLLKSLVGMRVLLAEDNAMNCMVAQGVLKKFGVESDVVEDGALALQKFIFSKKGYYDAILMDIQMPNMDGFQASKAIRESSHPDAKKIYIIALTANAFDEDIAKSFSHGMNDHVSKPIDTEELYISLLRALEKREEGM